MSMSEMITLAFILFVFGGASGVFTFVSLRLIAQKLQERGMFVQIEEPQQQRRP
jgi:uncharacterized protein YneF (UPF0154 family)